MNGIIEMMVVELMSWNMNILMLVVLAGLVNNLLPLAQPGVKVRSIINIAMIVAMIFCIVLLVSIMSAHLYGVFFLKPPDPNTTAGKVQLAAISSGGAVTPDFGDDASDWSNDGECDDPRFNGAGMTDTTLLEDDILHDAADCRAAWTSGEISLAGVTAKGIPDFGDDSSDFAHDGECDDPRFKGLGMTTTQLLSDDIQHDASDCEDAWDNGDIELR